MIIERATYKDYVIEYIYDGLQESRYRPGDKITESHIARELGISRAPIREALTELVGAGLLVYKPQVGNFVAFMSPTEIRDAYEIRGVLEGFAVRTAISGLVEEDIYALEQMAGLMEKYAAGKQQRRLIEVGKTFHQLLYGRCDNIQVVHLTDQLSMKLHLMFRKHWADVYSPAEIRDRHQVIIDCLQGADSMAVERAIREHYMETGSKVAALYSSKGQGSS